jgi:hypothetical protein
MVAAWPAVIPMGRKSPMPEPRAFDALAMAVGQLNREQYEALGIARNAMLAQISTPATCWSSSKRLTFERPSMILTTSTTSSTRSRLAPRAG